MHSVKPSQVILVRGDERKKEKFLDFDYVMDLVENPTVSNSRSANL
jgi:hypothetical protein